MVSHIDDDGFVSFDTIGGWDHQVFVGQRVRLLGRQGPVPGVVGKKAIHIMDKDDREKVSKVEDLWIDIGAASRAEAERPAPDRRPGRAGRRRARVPQRPAGEPLASTTASAPSWCSRRCGCSPPDAAPRGRRRHRRGDDPGGDRRHRRRRPLVGGGARARRGHRDRRDPRDRLSRHRQAPARRLPPRRRPGALARRVGERDRLRAPGRGGRGGADSLHHRGRLARHPHRRRGDLQRPPGRGHGAGVASPTATCTAPTR